MSGNHNGKLSRALNIIKAAKRAGADAIKLQTYRADTITLDSEKDDFLIPSENPWESHKTLFSLYEKASTPWEWHERLILEGKKLGMDVFSSPFDCSAVDFLESLKKILGDMYKVAIQEKSVRAGKGKMRGRKYKQNAGLLFVVGDEENKNVNKI